MILFKPLLIMLRKFVLLLAFYGISQTHWRDGRPMHHSDRPYNRGRPGHHHGHCPFKKLHDQADKLLQKALEELDPEDFSNDIPNS